MFADSIGLSSSSLSTGAFGTFEEVMVTVFPEGQAPCRRTYSLRDVTFLKALAAACATVARPLRRWVWRAWEAAIGRGGGARMLRVAWVAVALTYRGVPRARRQPCARSSPRCP